MALTSNEQTALRGIIFREGGVDAVVDLVRSLDTADKRDAVITTLQTAVSMTVSNWAAVASAAAQVPASAMPVIIGQIDAAAQARNQAALGPLAVALYGAAKKHLNL